MMPQRFAEHFRKKGRGRDVGKKKEQRKKAKRETKRETKREKKVQAIVESASVQDHPKYEVIVGEDGKSQTFYRGDVFADAAVTFEHYLAASVQDFGGLKATRVRMLVHGEIDQEFCPSDFGIERSDTTEEILAKLRRSVRKGGKRCRTRNTPRTSSTIGKKSGKVQTRLKKQFRASA